jgi:hypothetical protein
MSRKSLPLYSLLALAAALPAASVTVNAAEPAPPVQAIEGVWDSTVTLTSCQNPNIVFTSFRALNQFNRHGSLIATSQVAPPPSLGAWEWLGGRSYRASFRFQRFGAGGVLEGTTKVTREIELAADGNSFTGIVATELYDLTDTLFASGCGREAAGRLY